MNGRRKVTATRPWLMMRHMPGSDYGPSAYTLHMLEETGKVNTVIVNCGLANRHAYVIEAAPVMLAELQRIRARVMAIAKASRAAEYTDTDAVWTVFEEIKKDAERAMRRAGGH